MRRRKPARGPHVKPRCGHSPAIPWLRKGCKPIKIEYAKEMRANPTPSEAMLWQRLVSRRLGLKFRQQAIVRGWIVDFWCPAAKLVVEVDGPIHEGRVEYDQNRDAVMGEMGIEVLRVTNREVEEDLDGVCTRIFQLATKRLASKMKRG